MKAILAQSAALGAAGETEEAVGSGQSVEIMPAWYCIYLLQLGRADLKVHTTKHDAELNDLSTWHSDHMLGSKDRALQGCALQKRLSASAGLPRQLTK